MRIGVGKSYNCLTNGSSECYPDLVVTLQEFLAHLYLFSFYVYLPPSRIQHQETREQL